MLQVSRLTFLASAISDKKYSGKKNCICAELVQAFLLVIIPQTRQSDNYLHTICIPGGITGGAILREHEEWRGGGVCVNTTRCYMRASGIYRSLHGKLSWIPRNKGASFLPDGTE